MQHKVLGCAGCDKVHFNDLVSCTSLGGINIRRLEGRLVKRKTG
jgi:hypothetical protein